MKKASFILFKISTILGAVVAGIVLVSACPLLIMGFSAHIHGMLVDAYDSGSISWPFPFAEMDGQMFATLIQACLAATGFLCFFIGALCLIASILAIKVRKEPTRGLLIASIVLGAFSIDTMVLGGIFGLIALKKEKRLEE